MSDQPRPDDVMPPKLWEEARDPYARFIWRARDQTYVAGFRDRDAAEKYGERNGWKP